MRVINLFTTIKQSIHRTNCAIDLIENMSDLPIKNRIIYYKIYLFAIKEDIKKYYENKCLDKYVKKLIKKYPNMRCSYHD